MIYCSFVLSAALLWAVFATPSSALRGHLEIAPNPGIAFTSVPDWGSHDLLLGDTWGTEPNEYGVATYIFVGHAGGWWTKPNSHNPVVPVAPDGSWSVDITTGGDDALATTVAAYLVPLNYDPPILMGEWDLPDLAYPRVVECRVAGERRIDCFGREWIVKRADLETGPVGPGPNYFSDADSMVWCDAEGLHMRMAKVDGVWHSTEVIAAETSGYGDYIFGVEGAVDEFDPAAVLGLFTWDTCGPLDRRNPEPFYREIDIEVSRWTNPWEPDNTQFVIQPYWRPENIYRFALDVGPDLFSEHEFQWREGEVLFSTTALGANVQWLADGDDVPVPGAAHARINLWQVGETPPAEPQNVIIRNFEYRPASGKATGALSKIGANVDTQSLR